MLKDGKSEQTTALERMTRPQIEMPSVVPVSSYPVEIETEPNDTSLLEYLIVLRKRRWSVIGVMAIVILIVLIATLKQRPVYQAKAIIQIDRESPNVLNFQDFM